MAAVITALRWLQLDERKWSRVSPASLTSALFMASATWFLMAWNRFGGQIIDEPRAFLRMTLIGIYGWLGLGLAIWLIGPRLRPTSQPGAWAKPAPSLQHTLAAVGLAHSPPLILGFVIFMAAGFLRILGPGFLLAVFVLVFWFPAVLAAAIKTAFDLTWSRAVAAVSAPYVMWLVLVARHIIGQVQHLL